MSQTETKHLKKRYVRREGDLSLLISSIATVLIICGCSYYIVSKLI